MSDNHKLELENSQQALEYLSKHFLDVNLFPEKFTPIIIDYFKAVSIDEKMKGSVIDKCDDYLLKNRNDADFNPVLLQRASAIKQIMSIPRRDDTNLWNNLIISEINIRSSDIQNLDTSNDGQACNNQLSNLIIEEVDVADYIV